MISGNSWASGCTRVLEEFIGEHKAVKRVVAEIVNPADPPDAKLRKLYARAQQIRNLSFEREKTEKEEKREKLKDNENVEDVLKHGYGYGSGINELFVALARAAGFEASMVYVTGRNSGLFEPGTLSWRQLDANVVQVRLGAQEWYLDPATRYCPFSLLPWGETDTKGIRPEKEGGSFVNTPEPKSADAVTERTATLQLAQDGTLEGNVQVKFVGQEALERRLEHRRADEAGRRKALEDEVRERLPAGSTVELTNQPNWEGPEEPLRAEFHIKTPNFGTSTGRRLLLPLAVFQANGEVLPSRRPSGFIRYTSAIPSRPSTTSLWKCPKATKWKASRRLVAKHFPSAATRFPGAAKAGNYVWNDAW